MLGRRSPDPGSESVRVQSWIDEPALGGSCVDGLNTAIYKALGQADIEIPFPQRVVHVARPPTASS